MEHDDNTDAPAGLVSPLATPSVVAICEHRSCAASDDQGVDQGVAHASDAAHSEMFENRGGGPATRPRRSLRPDTLLGGLAFLLVATVFQRFVGFLRSVVFCKWMAPEDLGVWDVSYGFLLFAAPLVALGLPGTLTRYLEQFHRQGQLRNLLLKTVAGLFVSVGIAAAIILSFRDRVEQLLFGRSDTEYLVAAIVGALMSMVLFGLVLKLFVAMRLQRVASLMNFLYSLLFAVLGCLLLAFWRPTAISVVAAHCAALLATCLLACYWLWQMWQNVPVVPASAPKSTTWSKVVVFALALWVSTALTNVFALVDRYMIVHFSGLGTQQALSTVGQYYAARIVPMLMIAVGGGFAFHMLPHVTRDWEEAKRDHVAQRFDFTLRLTGLASLAFAAVFLAVGPVLFALAFSDKFAEGLSVLGLTLTSGVIFTIFSVGKLYLWCSEKAWLVSLSFLGALAVNVVGNVILLPRYGLAGVASAHCAAVFVLLLSTYAFSHWLGMRFRGATILISLLPFTLIAGPLWATLASSVVCVLAMATDCVFSRGEKQQIADALGKLKRCIVERRQDGVFVMGAPD